ncbi:hypothetical protein SELMODRAFT_40326, partial [Selaginella moellendorffii]
VFDRMPERNAVSWILMITALCRDGNVVQARRRLDTMPHRPVACYNAMMGCYGQNGHVEEASETFRLMIVEGAVPDEATFTSVLGACSHGGLLDHFRAMAGVEHVREHYCCVADILGRVGKLTEAHELLNSMPLRPGAIGWTSFESGRCGGIDEAKMVFSSMEVRDVVSWNSFLSAYARNGYSIRVLGLFEEMDVKPDKVTYLAVLDACATMAALQRGKEIHHRIAVEDEQLLSDTMLGNSLLNILHCRSGNLEQARKIFDLVERRRVVAWTAMLCGFAERGLGREALHLLREELSLEGIEPDHITLLGVIFGCGNAGLLEDGLEYLTRICDDYGLIPQMNHYGCMVDLL